MTQLCKQKKELQKRKEELQLFLKTENIADLINWTSFFASSAITFIDHFM